MTERKVLKAEFTYDELHHLVFAALEAGDMEAVERAMTYMAVWYPEEAELIMETAKFAQSLGREGTES